MLISDILVILLGAGAWCGACILYWLVRAQGSTRAPLLQQYLGIKLLAWSVLIGLETAWYFDAYDWLGEHWQLYQDVHRMAFRGLMALASWMLIKNLLQPMRLTTVPEAEAQVEMDLDGIICGFNAAAESLFGWTAAEAVGQELAQLIIPEAFREAHRHGVARYRETRHSDLIDRRYTAMALTRSGREVLVDVRLTAHLTSAGTRILGTVTPAMVVK